MCLIIDYMNYTVVVKNGVVYVLLCIFFSTLFMLFQALSDVFMCPGMRFYQTVLFSMLVIIRTILLRVTES